MKITHLSCFLFLGMVLSFCKKDEDRSAPHLTTTKPYGITESSAICEGTNILEDNIIEKGVCWSTETLPDIDGPHTSEGEGNEDFKSTITDLEPFTIYYVRAYATNKYRTGYGDIMSFTTNPPPNLPKFGTLSVTNVSKTTAICNSQITSIGNASIDSLGICWAKHSLPTKKDMIKLTPYTYSTFSISLQQLEVNTIYYARVFGATRQGTGYSDEISFRTYFGTVSDFNGNTYNTVKIGDLEWMVENLRASHFMNGNPTQYIVPNPVQWTSATSPAYCYNPYATPTNVYGNLYNWNTATDTRNIAPAGWHVATEADWQNAFTVLGGVSAAASKMKLNNTAYWSPASSTNESNFSAVGGGYRGTDGYYGGLYSYAYFWVNSTIPKHIMLSANSAAVTISENVPKTVGVSIRCVKD